MNSRDRLRDNELKGAIERELEQLLRTHPGLRALANRRRQEEITERLEESQPLEEVLRSLLRSSPTLRSLFMTGKEIPNPFAPRRVADEDKPYLGKRFPSFFGFKGLAYGAKLQRAAHLGQRPRITFETDAENDYFSRADDKGEISIQQQDGTGWVDIATYSINLQSGLAYLNFPLPEDALAGSRYEYKVEVTDTSRVDPFVNFFSLDILKPSLTSEGKGRRRRPRSDLAGDERDAPTHLALPKIFKIREADWENQDPPFDKHTALRVKQAPAENGNGDSSVYDFFVNVDNHFLRSEEKTSREPAELMESRFVHGIVLVGLAIIHDGLTIPESIEDESEGASNEGSVEQVVERVTRAIAPIVLPMIETLGSINLDD
jgi:hypothetical protein